MPCILVVDDDADLRDAVASTLERAGYAVRQAADGAEALDRAREHLPSAVLLDLQMPRLDGRGFLEARSASPTLAAVPVVLISSREAEVRALAAEFPLVHLLPKPFRAADLRAVVGRVAPAPSGETS